MASSHAEGRWVRLFRLLALLPALAAFACAPGGHDRDGGDGDGEVDGTAPGPADADGDGISDANEGRGLGVDTDGDGVPDYLDDDSDGDGIPDAIEGGTGGDASRAPVDTDSDGTPDFRDLDSDANGVFDQVEGWADTDGDGVLDYADWDNDGDLISDLVEIGTNPSSPIDTDGDGVPDYMDPDSDGDCIGDLYERDVDTDGDGVPDFRDLDSDNDGIPDREESGNPACDLSVPPRDTDGDSVPDFRDLDSDNDGLSDAAELAAGTSPTAWDTDGDGVSDLVEVAAGTDPLSAADSPRSRGDFVFVVPFEAPPDPLVDTLSFSTDIQYADVYFLMDTTGSMSSAITGLKTTLTGTIIPGIDAAIPDVMFGVGHFRDYPYSPYGSGGDVAYRNLQVMTDDPAAAQAAVNTMSAGGGYDGPESHVPALHALATGCGDGGGTYGIADDPDGACTDPSLIGYPHFRAGAVPIVVLFSDALFHNGPSGNNYGAIPGVTPPSYADALAALAAIHARVIGVSSSSYGRADLERLVRDTGTVDAAGTPFIYDQTAAFGPLVVDAVAAVSQQVPMDIHAIAVDDPSDAVDALVFIDRIVPTPAAAAPCTIGLTIAGDRYLDVLPGSTVCFDIVPRRNETVPPTTEPQIYTATVQVWGDEVTILDERDVYFLVPPRIDDPGIPD